MTDAKDRGSSGFAELQLNCGVIAGMAAAGANLVALCSVRTLALACCTTSLGGGSIDILDAADTDSAVVSLVDLFGKPEVSLQPKSEPRRFEPPNTTPLPIRSSSIHLLTIFSVSSLTVDLAQVVWM